MHTPVLALPQDDRIVRGSSLLLLSLGRFSCETATVCERKQLHDADGASDVAGQGADHCADCCIEQCVCRGS